MSQWLVGGIEPVDLGDRADGERAPADRFAGTHAGLGLPPTRCWRNWSRWPEHPASSRHRRPPARPVRRWRPPGTRNDRRLNSLPDVTEFPHLSPCPMLTLWSASARCTLPQAHRVVRAGYSQVGQGSMDGGGRSHPGRTAGYHACHGCAFFRIHPCGRARGTGPPIRRWGRTPAPDRTRPGGRCGGCLRAGGGRSHRPRGARGAGRSRGPAVQPHHRDGHRRRDRAGHGGGTGAALLDPLGPVAGRGTDRQHRPAAPPRDPLLPAP